MWNCGSFWLNGTPFTNISHVRHWLAAEAPAIRPTRAVMPTSSHRLKGAMPIR